MLDKNTSNLLIISLENLSSQINDISEEVSSKLRRLKLNLKYSPEEIQEKVLKPYHLSFYNNYLKKIMNSEKWISKDQIIKDLRNLKIEYSNITITIYLNSLEKSNYLISRKDSNDKRKRLYRLSKK